MGHQTGFATPFVGTTSKSGNKKLEESVTVNKTTVIGNN